MDNKSDEFIRDYILIINQSFDRTFPRKSRQNYRKFFSNDRRYPTSGRYFDACIDVKDMSCVTDIGP